MYACSRSVFCCRCGSSIFSPASGRNLEWLGSIHSAWPHTQVCPLLMNIVWIVMLCACIVSFAVLDSEIFTHFQRWFVLSDFSKRILETESWRESKTNYLFCCVLFCLSTCKRRTILTSLGLQIMQSLNINHFCHCCLWWGGGEECVMNLIITVSCYAPENWGLSNRRWPLTSSL